MDQDIRSLVSLALREDLGTGDVTVKALVPQRLRGVARIQSKEPGFVSGLDVAGETFLKVDGKLEIEAQAFDGKEVEPGEVLMTIRGRVASLLKAERTALNFLQRLSGVATLTSHFVRAVEGTRARILDTRKTTPGMRMLEKAAVRAGGGDNHRIGLYDMVLIKDNHLAMMGTGDAPCAVRKAVRKALDAAPPGMQVQVEVSTVEAAVEAGGCGAHMVLLDNMSPEGMAEAVLALERNFGEKRPLTEASGGISLINVHEVAESGVDRISIGALTHSAPALDIAMYIGFDT